MFYSANEMAERLLFSANRASSGRSPGYEDNELSYKLTEAQRIFVKQQLSPDLNQKREGFEESEIRAKGLNGLLATGSITIPSESGTANFWKPIVKSTNQAGKQVNGTFYDMPDDMMHVIHETVETNTQDCRYTEVKYLRIPVRPITHNEINRFINNKYKKPYIDGVEGLIWRLTYSRNNDGYTSEELIDISADQSAQRHELVTDGTFDVRDYFVRYLRIPPQIVVNFTNPNKQRHSVLGEQTHEAIIEIASKLLQSNTDRTQIPEIRSIENLE